MRDARGRTAELVALDLGHVDCAGLFYNLDIHSYTPKPIDSGAGGGRERGHDDSGSEQDGDDDDNADGDADDYVYQRDGETGEGARTSTSLRQGFDEAVAAARRASSLSIQQAEEGQADQRRPRASASSFASGEGVAQEDEAEEGQREGEQMQGYIGGYAEQGGENAQQYTEGYDGEGNANAEGDGADWEWSETEGWVRGRGGGSVEPAGTQAGSAALDEEQQDTTAAENLSDDEGYPGEEGYRGPRESESYSDWQQPYYPTAQGGIHGGGYDGEDQQQQFHSGQGGDGSYGTADGASNDNSPQQDQRDADPLGRASWEGSGRGDPAELLQETAEEEDDNQELLEAALGEGWALAASGKANPDEQGRNDGATASHDSTNGNGGDDNDDSREPESATAATFHGNLEDGSGRDDYSSPGWGVAVAVAKASNTWLSVLDGSSGAVYYQNERSGQTEWDVPKGAVVVSAVPEDI